MKIRTSLLTTVATLSFIIVGMFLATFHNTRLQKDDGLVINLAGRQRMLSQKITKEILHFYNHATKQEHPDSVLADNIRNTAAVFEKTLSALIHSGEAPVSLDLKTTSFRHCPAAHGEVLTQLEEVNKLWSEYTEHMTAVLAAPTQSESDLNWILQNNVPLLASMNKAVGMMQQQAEVKIKRLLAMLLTGIVMGGSIAVVGFITVRSILKRLDAVQVFAKQLESGNLSATVELRGQDELASISRALNGMGTQLRRMVQGITENASTLNESSQQLVHLAQDMVQNAEDTSGRSNTVASATEEMSNNMATVATAIEQASGNIGAVSNAAEQMTGAITEIAQNTERATTITLEAVGEAQSASDLVNKLGAAANEINKVTETITEISEQTNLLALNATIEAARAGDAGKGFAVVANEIKDLANQTAEATEDIRHKIEGIQGSTSQTVTEIEKITKIISEVNDIVTTIASAVEEQSVTTRDIAGNVTHASHGIAKVSESVSQTSAVSSEVAQDISGVHQTAGQVASSSTQLKASAESLNTLSQQLQEMVSQYTT